MKRRLILVLLLLVGGAILNVAVAWGCACWSPLTMALFAPLTEPEPWHWRSNTPEDWPAAPNYVGRDESFGVSERYTEWVDARPGWLADQPAQEWVLSSGWPFRSMFIERHRILPREPCYGLWKVSVSQWTWDDGWPIPAWMPGSERGQLGVSGLPLKPIWPGFAINTVFYAGVLWLLFAAPFALRRRRRIKRGLCPKCAYDLRGCTGDACPECGATK